MNPARVEDSLTWEVCRGGEERQLKLLGVGQVRHSKTLADEGGFRGWWGFFFTAKEQLLQKQLAFRSLLSQTTDSEMQVQPAAPCCYAAPDRQEWRKQPLIGGTDGQQYYLLSDLGMKHHPDLPGSHL